MICCNFRPSKENNLYKYMMCSLWHKNLSTKKNYCESNNYKYLKAMFEINAEVLANTIHCKKNHGCLTKESSSYCLNIEIVKCVGNKLLFVKCNNSFCRYRMKYAVTDSFYDSIFRNKLYGIKYSSYSFYFYSDSKYFSQYFY